MHRAAVAVLFLALACSPPPPSGGATDDAVAVAEALADPAQLGYAADLGVNVSEMRRLPADVLVADLVVGTGDSVVTGSRVAVRYTGWLRDGTRFDGNRNGPPFVFRVGAGEVIEGWDVGIPGMRVGGKRKLVLPPAMAYGEMGSGPIPPHATLVFDVEVLELRP